MFYKYFLVFIFYSFIGFIIEFLRCLYLFKKKINRGFLIGPIIPIYGVSALILIYFSKYKDNFLFLSLLIIISICIVEYLTSFLMEKLFHARFWDYSNKKLNINGRVCLLNIFYFYIFSICAIYYLNDFILKLSIIIPNEIIIIIFILFLTDLFLSTIIIFSIRKQIKVIKKDNTEEISEIIKDILLKEKYPKKRLLKGFFYIK